LARFFATALVLLFPGLGPFTAMGIMYGTPELNAPAPKWRTILFSPRMIGICWCVFLGLIIVQIAIPQFYAFRVKSAQASFKEAKQHLAAAKEAGEREDVRKELDKAASRLAGLRRSALTDANTGWYLRWSLSNSLIKESELAALEKEIEAAKMNSTGRK